MVDPQADLDEAFCRDVHHLSVHFPARETEARLAVLAVVLGVVAVIVLLVLGCVALSGCVCWCCVDSCRQKVGDRREIRAVNEPSAVCSSRNSIFGSHRNNCFQFENLFSSNSYTKDLESGDEKAGGDTLGEVRPG